MHCVYFIFRYSSLSSIEVSSTTQISYSTTIRKCHDFTRIPSTVEHVEFLWVLLYRYVFFPNSRKSSREYLPLAKTIALGWPYALGTLLLGSVYQAMSKYVSDKLSIELVVPCGLYKCGYLHIF